MYLIVSLVYILIFYATGFYKTLSRNFILFPFLGADGSWVVTALLIYFALGLIFWLFNYFSDLYWPKWPKWRQRLTSNVGLKRFDSWFFYLSLFFAFFFLFSNPSLLPLALVCLLGTYLTS
jgi:H+/Cl- antiporter ClcA